MRPVAVAYRIFLTLLESKRHPLGVTNYHPIYVTEVDGCWQAESEYGLTVKGKTLFLSTQGWSHSLPLKVNLFKTKEAVFTALRSGAVRVPDYLPSEVSL